MDDSFPEPTSGQKVEPHNPIPISILNDIHSQPPRMMPPIFQAHSQKPSSIVPGFISSLPSSADEPFYRFQSLSGVPTQRPQGVQFQHGYQPDVNRFTHPPHTSHVQSLQRFHLRNNVPQCGLHGRLFGFQVPYPANNFDAFSTGAVLRFPIALRHEVVPTVPSSNDAFIQSSNCPPMQSSGQHGLESNLHLTLPQSLHLNDSMASDLKRSIGPKEGTFGPSSSLQMSSSSCNGLRNHQQAGGITSNETKQNKCKQDIFDCKSSYPNLLFLTKIQNSLQTRKTGLLSESCEINQVVEKNGWNGVVLTQEARNRLEYSLSLLKEEEKLVERRLHLMEQTVRDTESMVRELSATRSDGSSIKATQNNRQIECSPIIPGTKPGNLGDSTLSAEKSTQDEVLDINEDELLNLDDDEWFEERRKDPIVQDYIKAFEMLISQPSALSVSNQNVPSITQKVCSFFLLLLFLMFKENMDLNEFVMNVFRRLSNAKKL